MTAEIIQDDVLHALSDFEPKTDHKEESKEETPLFPSLENDDSELVTR